MLTKTYLVCALLIYMLVDSSLAQSVDLSHGHLTVSADKRFIVFEDGTPFFWLGDTAWEIFHRSTREEADLYLKNRAAKGFTVIQAVVLAELDGLNTPNAYGHKPLLNNNPAKPNEAYFEHVDYIVQKAQEYGMFIGMLPTWGDKFNKKWGVGPEIFTPQNAYLLGLFLGKRYKNSPIIWILGGDRTCDDEEDIAIIRQMARGLADGDQDKHLMTYHPQGGYSSSRWFHKDNWLDINLFQSGHGEKDNYNFRSTENDYNLRPVKPVLDGEPCYEDHPVNWRAENGWFDAFDSRRAGYWSMLSGACGHTYGNHNIWQMWLPGRDPISAARTPWYQALDYPGAFHAGIMRRIFEDFDWQKLNPAPQIIKSGPNAAGKVIRASMSDDNSLILVYSPFGSAFSLDNSKIKLKNYYASWIDPRSGNKIEAGTHNIQSNYDFDPPADETRANDWLLILTKKLL